VWSRNRSRQRTPGLNGRLRVVHRPRRTRLPGQGRARSPAGRAGIPVAGEAGGERRCRAPSPAILKRTLQQLIHLRALLFASARGLTRFPTHPQDLTGASRISKGRMKIAWVAVYRAEPRHRFLVFEVVVGFARCVRPLGTVGGCKLHRHTSGVRVGTASGSTSISFGISLSGQQSSCRCRLR
jgi:hypothetical protein